MAVMSRSDFAKGLQEGLNTYFGLDYKSHNEEWRRCFDVEASQKSFEEDVLVSGFGAAVVKPEGSGITFDDASESWTARYTHETIALAFSITEEAIEDNLYMSMGAKYAKALSRSMIHTKEIKGAAVLNNGFNSSFTGGDGKELLATDHPLIGGGTASNELATPADFSETALEDILIQIRKTEDDRGIPISLNPKQVVIPPELEYVACRILGSELRSGTADNDLNALNYKGIFSMMPDVVTRLTDGDAWFVRTDCPQGLLHFNRKGLKKKMEEDFNTGNYLYKTRERYSFGWSDWRSLFGSAGAA